MGKGDGRVQLAKHFIYLSGAETISKLATFAAIAYVARILGPTGLGYVEFAGSVLLCAGLLVDQGFGPYGAREIAKAPPTTASLVSEIVCARIGLALVAYAVVALFAMSIDRPAAVTQLLLAYGLSLLVTPFLLNWVFQGHNRMETVAAMQVIRQTVFAGVVFIFFQASSQLWVMGMAESAGVAGAAAFGLWAYRWKFGFQIVARFANPSRLFREGVPIGLSQMFWMLRMFGATALLGLIALPQDVGFFGAAMRILVALHAFVWLYFFNLLPSLSRAWQEGDGSFMALTSRSLHLVSWAGVLGGLVWVSVAQVVMVGVYGFEFVQATATLQWLAGVCVVAALSGHYRFGLIAAGQQNLEMAASAIGAVVALVSVPIGYASVGPAGAAMGLLAAELMVWWSTWWWASTRLRLESHALLLIRPGLAALTGAGLLWTPWSPSEITRAVVALAVVGVLVLALDGSLRRSLGGCVVALRNRGRVQPNEQASRAL